jgi:hypothetical protein
MAVDPSLVDVDVARFERLVADGSRPRLEQAVAVLRQNRIVLARWTSLSIGQLETSPQGKTPCSPAVNSAAGRGSRATEDRQKEERHGERKCGRLGLRRASDVAVMQATNFGNRDDGAELRRLDRPSVGSILVERQVSASLVIVGEVRGEETSKVPLAEDDDVVEALAPDRPDESLGEGILPWAVRGREKFTDPHTRHTLPEVDTVDCVAVAEEVNRCGIVREGIHDLLGAQWAVGCPVTLKWTTRCHRRTVSGVTIIRGRRYPAQILASTTQKRRSVWPREGRAMVCL